MMKKLNFCLLLSVLMFFSCGKDGDTPSDDQPTNKAEKLINDLDKKSELMAYYPFNDSAADKSSNKRNGELKNVTVAKDRFGNEKSAYNFGLGAFVKIPSFGEVESFTITAWIKLSSEDENNERYNAIVSKYKKSGEYVFRQNSKRYGQVLSTHFTSGANGIGGDEFGALVPDVWIHVGMSYDKGKVTLYHNGVKSEEKLVNPIQWNQGDVMIGAYGEDEFFYGTIDDVLFASRKLTLEEIKILADHK